MQNIVKPSDIEIIGPSPLKLLGTMGLGALGMTAGMAMLSVGLFGLDWLRSSGWMFVAAVAAVACCAFLGALLGRRPRVEIGPEGFVARPLVGGKTRRWSDVDGDFVQIKVGFGRGVGYRLTRAFKESAGIKPTTLFAGNDEAISGAFVVPVGRLVELLNQAKARAAGASTDRT